MKNGGAYYNEHDPFAAAWLRQLIAAGQIAPGEVDERSIEDVCPGDLRGFNGERLMAVTIFRDRLRVRCAKAEQIYDAGFRAGQAVTLARVRVAIDAAQITAPMTRKPVTSP